MRTKVIRWGNSLGLRIPKSFAKEVRVTEGTVVDLSMEDDCLIIRVAPQVHGDLDELVAGITDENLHGEVDTGDAAGGEVW